MISYSPTTLKALVDATGFEVARINFTAVAFNFVRSMKYLVEEKGQQWPQGLRRIPWDRSKFIRRMLKPLFFFVDKLDFGDFLHATLRK